MTTERRTTRLSAGAVMVLKLIEGWCAASRRRKQGEWACVSRRHLARLTQRSLRTVSRYIAELRDAAEIEVQDRTIEDGSRDWSLYRIVTTPLDNPDKGGGDNPDKGGGDTRPYLQHLTQQQLSAAAADEVRSEEKTAEAVAALVGAGMSATTAGRYAATDHGGLCKLAAGYFAECAANKAALNQVVTLGLLIEFLRKPADYFTQDDAGTWQPPRDSMMHKNMREAEVACNRAARKDALRRQEEARAAEEAATAPARAAQQAADAAAWDGLPDDERRSIERIVRKSHPLLPADGFSFRTQCVLLMRRFLAAQAEAAALAALDTAERAHVEALARQLWPVFCSTEQGFRNACLMVLANRRAAGGPHP